MKEFVISEVKAETAILVGLITNNQSEAKTKEYLDELEFLADTAGAVTVKRFTQKANGPSAVTYVGKGKLEEIKNYIETCEENEEPIGMVIFDDELSAKQIRNIENELKVKILDRTSLILDIFAMRAQTANAKTQVELAQYRAMEAFAMFASDLDDASKAQLTRGARLTELLRQPQYTPYAVEEQVVSIWAGTNGYLDDLEVSDVLRFEAEFIDYLRHRTSVLSDIAASGKLEDETLDALKAAVADFKKGFRSEGTSHLVDAGHEEHKAAQDRDITQETIG